MKTFLKVWLSIGLVAIILGIGFLVLAAVTGATWKDVPTYSVNEVYEGVEKLDIEINYSEVKIVEGDNFSIDAENMLVEGLESYVTDGTWVIREGEKGYMNISGLRFSISSMIRWNDDLTPRITITIPKGFLAENFILNVGAGDVKAETILAKDGNFTVEAGRLTIDQLEVSGKSQYNVGVGDMELRQVVANDITLDCGIGNILLEGMITGDNVIDCGIGRVELNLMGDENDYSYKVDVGIGNVIINGDSYHNNDNERINNKGARNNLDLECGIGNITVEFN